MKVRKSMQRHESTVREEKSHFSQTESNETGIDFMGRGRQHESNASPRARFRRRMANLWPLQILDEKK